MAERLPTDQGRSFWGKIPFPTMLTLCLVALGIAAAAFWGWEVVVAFDLGILLLCGLDYTMTLKGGNIEAERVCHPIYPPASSTTLRLSSGTQAQPTEKSR